MARKADTHAGVLLVLLIAAAGLHAAGRAPAQPASPPSNGTLAQLIGAVRAKAKVLEGNAGMRLGFRSFLTASKIRQESVSYPDYVLVRVLYEATRDAGFWNLHWKITDREPNSDNIWRQWAAARTPSSLTPTASAECDELSALYAFLAGRAGVKGVGLFWPSRIIRSRCGLCAPPTVRPSVSSCRRRRSRGVPALRGRRAIRRSRLEAFS